MHVSAWSGGSKRYPTYGVRVGKKNRDEYFHPEWDQVILRINGDEAAFTITSGFWRQCPEIRDNKHRLIRSWLETHYTLPWPYRQPPHFQLKPIGGNRFELITSHPQTPA